MTSTPMTGASSSAASVRSLWVEGWICAFGLGALFVLFHHVILYRTFLFATQDANWSHALAIPLISLFYIYQKRHELMQTQSRLCWWGLPILFTGFFSYAFGILRVRNDMFQGYAMILGLFGLVLLLLGPAMMRILWFPILFLGFGIKISDRIWEEVAFQMQQIAAVGATFVLKLLAELPNRLYTANFEGSTIELGYWTAAGGYESSPLNVAEACAGLRMLMAFLALGAAVAFLWDRTWWQKIIMVAMAAPIAIAVNIARVAVLGLLFPYNPEFAAGGFHQMIGMFMLIPALGLFLLLGWVLDNVVVREKAAGKRGETRQDTRGDSAPTGQTMNSALLPACVGAGVGLGAVTGVIFWALGGGLSLGLVAFCVGGGAALGGLFWAGSERLPVGRLAMTFGLGAALAGLFWASYVMLLGSFRPDLLLEGAPAGLMAAGVVVTALLFLGGLVMLPGWFSRKGGPAQLMMVLMVGGVLVVSIGGQNAATAATGAVLFKEQVPLRHHLDRLPIQVGSWTMIHEAPPLSREIQEELGTDKYLTRIYEDQTWNHNQPGGRVRLHIAYYTGTLDTVPHVPERCFVGAGMNFDGRGLTQIPLESERFEIDELMGGYLHPAQREPLVRLPTKVIPTTRFTYSERNTSDRRHNVLYFFVANGQFIATPDGVRLHGFDPRDRYSYYAKVEMQVIGVDDEDLSTERASALMSEMMPEIMALLPDWHEVEQGEWPPAQ